MFIEFVWIFYGNIGDLDENRVCKSEGMIGEQGRLPKCVPNENGESGWNIRR